MKIKWNPAGFEEILRSPPVQAKVQQHTNQLATRAGDGYTGSVRQGKTRVRGIVYADSWKARRDLARNNTLLRVLG